MALELPRNYLPDNLPRKVKRIIRTDFRLYWVEIFEFGDSGDYEVSIYRPKDANKLLRRPIAVQAFPRDVSWVEGVRQMLTEIERPLHHRHEFKEFNGYIDTSPPRTLEAEYVGVIEQPKQYDLPRVTDWREQLTYSDDEQEDDWQ